MSKIELILEKMDPKSKRYLYAIIPIFLITVYINFLYDPIEKEKGRLNEKKSELIKELDTCKTHMTDMKKRRQEHTQLLTCLEEKQEEVRYLKVALHSLKRAKLTKESLISLIDRVLLHSKNENLSVTVDIVSDQDTLFPNAYLLEINGKGEFNSLMRFLDVLERSESIIHFDTIEISKESGSDPKTFRIVLQTVGVQ